MHHVVRCEGENFFLKMRALMCPSTEVVATTLMISKKQYSK